MTDFLLYRLWLSDVA